jgi:hypothetical protein
MFPVAGIGTRQSKEHVTVNGTDLGPSMLWFSSFMPPTQYTEQKWIHMANGILMESLWLSMLNIGTKWYKWYGMYFIHRKGTYILHFILCKNRKVGFFPKMWMLMATTKQPITYQLSFNWPQSYQLTDTFDQRLTIFRNLGALSFRSHIDFDQSTSNNHARQWELLAMLRSHE